MKTSFIFRLLLLAVLIIGIGSQTANAQFLKNLKKQVSDASEQGVEQAATNHAVNDAGNTTDKGISAGEKGIGNLFKRKKKKNNNNSTNSQKQNDQNANEGNNNSTPSVPTLEVYKNYDFVPGDSIIFADDFSDDMQGELPAHWKLDNGQGQVNEFDGEKIFKSNMDEFAHATIIEPRMKKGSGYMPKAFTIEFDMWVAPGSLGGGESGFAGVFLYGDANNPDGPITDWPDLEFGSDEMSIVLSTLYNGPSYTLPDNIGENNFLNKWHHVAIAYRDGQMKIYLDQNRIYVIPQVKDPKINKFGIGVTKYCYVTNVRLAEGGGMTMLQKKFTADKIVTHGITFDVDKSDLKPESMGTLNMIERLMNKNPDVKFEIDGHTDNTGQAAHNLTLSQERADAVKAQLVKMGIDASRLTTKGFGDTVPIADNSTPDGRANNRRVEFVRMK